MPTPAVQRLGSAVLLQGPAVADVAFLVGLGMRYRARVDGTAPSAHHRALLSTLNDTAEATLAADVRDGHTDVRHHADASQSDGVGVDSETAARLMGISMRQVCRLAPELGGRRVGRVWTFDRAAVLAAVAHRKANLETGANR